MKNTALYAACAANFRLAQEQKLTDGNHVWMVNPAGVQFSIIRQNGVFDIYGRFDYEGNDVFRGWLSSTGAGVYGARHRRIAGVFPQRFRQALSEARPMPRQGTIYGVRRSDNKIAALLHAWLGADGGLSNTTYVLRGAPMPDILAVSNQGSYVDPVKFYQFQRRGQLVRCTQLVANSRYPVLRVKGSQNGRGSCIIIRDDWAGIIGQNNLAVYEYWRTIGSANVQEALRTGDDIRADFR
jgi:hypothetical protein